jgi:hypothetical protein
MFQPKGLKFINKILFGNRLSVLGAKKTGKTSLLNFLTNGELKGGTGIEKTKKNKFKMKDLNLRIRAGLDITGSEDFVNNWENEIKKSDYTFYLINFLKIEEEGLKYLELIEFHFGLIRKAFSDPKRKLYILILYCDKSPEYLNNKNKFEKNIKENLNPVLRQISNFTFIGSLVNEVEKSTLVYNILNTIKSK